MKTMTLRHAERNQLDKVKYFNNKYSRTYQSLLNLQDFTFRENIYKNGNGKGKSEKRKVKSEKGNKK